MFSDQQIKMMQLIVCILMLVFTEGYAANESPTFLIKHYSGGKYWHPEGGSSNPSDNTAVILHRGYHANTYFRFEYAFDHWGYIKHVSSGKYVHPKDGSVNPPNNKHLLIHSGKHWGCLFALDAARDLIIHKGGKRFIHPDGGSVSPSDYTRVLVHSGTHDATYWKFVSVDDPSKEVLIYGEPTMIGDWKIINMVRDPIAEHTTTLEIKVGKSTTQSTTSSFQYTWEVSAGVEIKIFSASVSQSFSYMVEKTSSSTWYEETTRTRQIKVSPGQTVVTWQYMISVEQNLSKLIFQSDLLADTDSETKVPEDVQYAA